MTSEPSKPDGMVSQMHMEDQVRQLGQLRRQRLIRMMQSMVEFNLQALVQLYQEDASDKEKRAVVILKNAVSSFQSAVVDVGASVDEVNDLVWVPTSLNSHSSSLETLSEQTLQPEERNSESTPRSELEIVSSKEVHHVDLGHEADVLKCQVYSFKVVVATILYHIGVSFHHKAISLSDEQDSDGCARQFSNAQNFYQMSESLLQSRPTFPASLISAHSPLILESLSDSVQTILNCVRRNELAVRAKLFAAEAA
jgi:hypothetical protein